MRTFIALLFALFAVGNVSAQVEVASFRLLDNDLTANRHATMVKDMNGEVTALIRVVTSEQGFVFDGGSAGIVTTKQHVGEIWVYVPRGITHITIQHPQLGVLRDYYFPVVIEKARTYEMILKLPVQSRETRQGGLTLVFMPPTARVLIDGDDWTGSTFDGTLRTRLPYGQHTYEVMAEGYEPRREDFVMDSSIVNLRVELAEQPVVIPQDTVALQDSVMMVEQQLPDSTFFTPNLPELPKATTLGSPTNRSNPYWRSLLVPGWGDKYVRESRRFGVMKAVGAYGLIGAGVGMHFYAKEQYARYESMALENYIGSGNYSQATLDEQYQASNTYRKTVPLLIGAGAAVWLYDVIWVAVKGRKSSNTALALDFDPQANNGYLSYSITF